MVDIILHSPFVIISGVPGRKGGGHFTEHSCNYFRCARTKRRGTFYRALLYFFQVCQNEKEGDILQSTLVTISGVPERKGGGYCCQEEGAGAGRRGGLWQ